MFKTKISLLLFILVIFSQAIACEFEGEPYKLSLEGITIFAGNYVTGPTFYDLFDGICVITDEGWEIRSDRITLEFIEDSFLVKAESVRVFVFDWVLEAIRFEAIPDKISLFEATILSSEVAGTTDEAIIDVPNSEILLRNISASTDVVHIQSETAILNETELLFQNAIATTCMCADEAIYKLLVDDAAYDYLSEELSFTQGQLVIGGLSIDLGAQQLSNNSFEDFSFPITLSYIEDAGTTRGTGLGINVPEFKLTEDLFLELGLLGLDSDYDLRSRFLIHFAKDNINFTVGKNAFGPQADFSLTQPHLPWLASTLSMQNRHWQEADFLHNGSYSLKAANSFVAFDQTLTPSVVTTLSASSQEFNENTVVSARIKHQAKLNHKTTTTDLGQLSSSLALENTYYPQYERNQFGVTLVSNWSKKLSFSSTLAAKFEQVWTDSNSPFSTTLDKLTAKSLLSANLTLKERMSSDLSYNIHVASSYDFLSDAEALQQFDNLAFDFGLTWQNAQYSLSPYIRGNLASLINPINQDNNKAFSELGIKLSDKKSTWELEQKNKWHLLDGSLQKLELNGAYGFDLGELWLKPFVALDFQASLVEGALPRVAGHGLELSWDSCCGIIDVSYRQYENKFSSTFGVRFE